MEFLGDSVLELAIAKELYDRYPEASEGRLAKIRSTSSRARAAQQSRWSCAWASGSAKPRARRSRATS
jgi:dsRNA-specific ribonuclease